MKPSERFVRTPQEWVHAVTLFGKCNGTDWSVLMTVAHFTWGLSRESAEIGLAVFRDRLGQKDESIRQSLARLTKKPAEGGYGMIRVVQESSHIRARVLALENDWMAWAWDDEKTLARCSVAMTAYRKGSRSVVSDWAPTELAITLATELREHCIGVIPEAEVPPMELTNATWRRWLQTFETLLERRTDTLLGALLRFVARDPYYRAHILGEQADQRLSREIDSIHARYIAHAQKRRTT